MQSLKANRFIISSKSYIYFLILSIYFFAGCSQNVFDNEEKLTAYLQDESNGYVQKKTVNGVDFNLMYRPTDLLVKQELTKNDTSKEEIKRLRNKYSKYIYFNLSISINSQELLSAVPKDRNEFGAMVNQLAFGMRNKVHLYTQAKDTFEMVDFVYPRMYGMSKATSMMFVYQRDGEKLDTKTLNFTIEDLGLLTGEVKFKIGIDKLNNEPQLNIY